MTPWDPMAVAVDWLDAYRAARINQIVGMHSPDAVIEHLCHIANVGSHVPRRSSSFGVYASKESTGRPQGSPAVR